MPALLGEWRTGAGSLAQRLADAVDQAVERGELVEGWTLPAERGLSSALDISRSTTVRAMELLRQRGTVRRVQGAGTYVAGRPATTRRASLPPGLRARYRLGSSTDPGIAAAAVPSASDLPSEALTLTA